MDVTEDAVRDVCTDAVFERGERYLTEGRIHEMHRVDTTVTAVVSGSRQYDVRVDLATNGFAPWCDCPYNGPGACKHVVAVLLRCVDDPPPAKAINSTSRSMAPTPTNSVRSCVTNSRPMRISAPGFSPESASRRDSRLTSFAPRSTGGSKRRTPSPTLSSSPSTSRSGSTSRTSTASRSGTRRRRPSTGHSSSRSTTTWSASTARTITSRVRSVRHSMGTSAVSRPRSETLVPLLTPSHSSTSGRCRERRSSRNTSRRPRSNSGKRRTSSPASSCVALDDTRRFEDHEN
ncbi:SWIM zinc finger containing protein (plasmid) [Halapricum desulfuricans]|uniref:SWIM zinc finger containing protein n=1 Tax=Halapricum desulfuricans TaxID=2841257 RepID=A0A897NL10_9EURY|nr:SWIM zinc finger containing protein [Halapricum desulfuricans]